MDNDELQERIEELDDSQRKAYEAAVKRTEEKHGAGPAPGEGPEPDEAQTAQPDAPPWAVKEATSLMHLVDLGSRTAFGAPLPDGAELDLTSGEGRAEMAGRLAAPAYARLVGDNPVPDAVQAVGALVALVGIAWIQGQLADGEGEGEDEESHEPPEGVRRPGESGDGDQGEEGSGRKLSIGAQADGNE